MRYWTGLSWQTADEHPLTDEPTSGVDVDAASAPAAGIVHDQTGTTDEGLGRMTRRRAMALAAVAVALARTGLELSSPELSAAGATEIGPQPGSTRADAARQVRVAAADFQRAIPIADHPDNGDEALYPDRSASYTKALLHDGAGNVSTSEYNKLIAGLSAGTASGIEALAVLPGARKLANPLASLARGLEGADSHAFGIPRAPTFTSDQTAGEMAELYWMALCRDIPFDGYANSATISAAIGDLNGFRDTRIPKESGTVTVRTVFRDELFDSLSGNYISQYLLQTVPYGAQRIQQATRRPAGPDYLTDPTDFAAVQNGASRAPAATQDYRYIRNGRDLAEFVHSDFPEQACLNAALIIAAQGNQGDAKVSPLINDPNNPYIGYTAQSAFVTFGNEAFFNLVTRVMQLALQAAWYQKWLVHRRLRPEEMGGKIDATLRLGRSFPVKDQLRASLSDPARLGRIQAANGGRFLLPAAYPEGSPTHPAYPSGHSTYVAAGVTMIKAFVDGTLVVKDPVRIADPNNGDTLTSISANLTINGELDKLVSNIGLARLFAGVHWRSDHWYGVRLGELVAIRALQDLARTYPESFSGWRLRRFDLSNVLVAATQVTSGNTPGGQPVLTTNTIT